MFRGLDDGDLEMKVGGADDAGGRVEDCRLEDGGEFAYVAGPGVLEEARHGAGRQDGGGLLVVAADAVDEGLRDGSDVFAVVAQRGEREADSGEAEGEVGQELALSGEMAERGLGGGEQEKIQAAG